MVKILLIYPECKTCSALRIDEVAERSPWNVPEHWPMIAVVAANVEQQRSSLDVVLKNISLYLGASM